MRNASFALILLAFVVACSDDRGGQQTGPSPTPPSTPTPTPNPPSAVALRGTVSAAPTGSPLQNVGVQVVEGVNRGRQTLTDSAGRYELANLEPGAFTLHFSASEYGDLERREVVQADTTLDIQLEKKGFVLSGRISTQWGDSIGDVGVEAIHDGRQLGGGASGTNGVYRIPTLPATDYTVRAIKWGYLIPQRPVTITGDTTLDLILDRVRVSIFGAVLETPPCTGLIQEVRVQIVSGPDVGIGTTSTGSEYQLQHINWGTFWIRASKSGYRTRDAFMNVSSPGSKEGPQELPAPSNVRQDFLLERIIAC